MKVKLGFKITILYLTECLFVFKATFNILSILFVRFPGTGLLIQETQVWSLGRKDPPEKEMATNSSILPWIIPWTKEPGGLQSMGLQRVRHD